ncbi:MAG: DinB family protein [Rhodothermales bacterium]
MDFHLADGIAVLERTPGTLRALLAGLPAAWFEANEGPDTWSPFDVVGHLLHGERTDWIPRARIILEQGADRRFKPFDRFAQFEENADASLEDLLQAFERARRDSLTTLTGWTLSAAELDLAGEHPEFGEVTLRQLLATWVAHDLSHIAQIGRVMAKQYRDAVGPWRAYLPIMDR